MKGRSCRALSQPNTNFRMFLQMYYEWLKITWLSLSFEDEVQLLLNYHTNGTNKVNRVFENSFIEFLHEAL